MISKIRHCRLPVSAALIVGIHDITDMSVTEIRELMADRRAKYRFSDARGKQLILEQISGNRPEPVIWSEVLQQSFYGGAVLEWRGYKPRFNQSLP